MRLDGKEAQALFSRKNARGKADDFAFRLEKMHAAILRRKRSFQLEKYSGILAANLEKVDG